MSKDHGFSHISSSGEANMVDVGDKAVSKRQAVARAIVDPGKEIIRQMKANGFQTKKGPLLQIAKLAGIMGTKHTSLLIPLCHNINIDKASVELDIVNDQYIQIDCTCTTHGKTGVEMEALTGASIAALTIYDMCKALSHDIVIQEIKLMEKTGGKRDFKRTSETR